MINCKGLASRLPKYSIFAVLVVVGINLFAIHHFGVLITTRLSMEFEELRNQLSKDTKELSNRLSTDFEQLKIRSSKDIPEIKGQLSKDVQELSSRLSTELEQLKSHLPKDVENLTSHLAIKNYQEPGCTLGNYFCIVNIYFRTGLFIRYFIIADYINSKRLPQDDRCVIEIIRRDFLRAPSPRKIPYALNHPDKQDPSAGQVPIIFSKLNNLVSAIY